MWDIKPEYGSGLFNILSTLKETSVKHRETVVYKDDLDVLGNCFPLHICCNCPALASAAVAEEELLKKT